MSQTNPEWKSNSQQFSGHPNSATEQVRFGLRNNGFCFIILPAEKLFSNIKYMEKRMRKDKYLRARGGTARMLNIHCAHCAAWILRYQKDGVGQLLRCYLNRIFAPPELAALQQDSAIRELKDVPNLVCPNCKTVIGTPMRYEDGRLAYRLMKGTYAKRIAKGE